MDYSWKVTLEEYICKRFGAASQHCGCCLRTGARWSATENSLVDPRPKELFSSMPLIHLLPEKDRKTPTSGIYRSPVYKILTRTGTLSTTGHSTNFVMWIEIPSNKSTVFRSSLVSETNAQVKFCDQDYWIRAGVACFCALKY